MQLRFNDNLLYNVQFTAWQYALSSCNIYQGAIPTVTPSFTWSASNYTSQLLATATLTLQSPGASSTRISTSSSIPFDGVATGTATWFCMHNGGALALIGTLSSDPATKAPMLLDNVNIVPSTGKPFSIVSLSVYLS